METIRIETDPRGVARLTLARSQKHNALSAQMMDELTQAAHDLGRDPEVRVVVLAAEGGTFCAGGDLAWMQAQMDLDAAARAKEAGRLAWMLNALNVMPKPLIGAISGNAFGGGIGMMSVCDVAIGVSGASFGLTETRLGLIPATIGPYVVARMGEAKARRVFMSSRIFDATEAERLGLLARVVPPQDLAEAIEAEVRPYLSCAPGAVADAKALLRALGPAIDDNVIAMTIEALGARWAGAEAPEGVAAFFAKRKASWQS